ncbi:MAG: N-acetylmuramoyl-L-alanine amidase, partial [Ktedonobacteraceae bacterium]
MRIRSRILADWIIVPTQLVLALLLVLFAPFANGQGRISRTQVSRAGVSGPLNQAFEQATHEFGVPSALLKAICYMEGRLSDQDGDPSVDNGFGCMHLVKNKHSDTLDQAARELKLNAEHLKLDLPANIRGGAAILRDDALHLSSTHRLPNGLGNWYGAVATYSASTTRSTALMYANNVYKILHQGFSAPTDSGEIITLAPQA